MPFGVKPCGGPRYGKPSNRLSRRANLSVVTSLHYLNFYYRVNFPRRRVYERVELLWIASTYLVGMNESGNQKGNFSYLANTKGVQKFPINQKRLIREPKTLYD